MLRNFLVTSLRILWRNKVVSVINILSLSIGITAFILILLYVHHETSYDKFNENYDRIYRLEGDGYAKLPPLVGEYLADKIPEIEQITQLQVDVIRNFSYIPPDNPENGIAIPTHVLRADSVIFDVFTLPLVQGASRQSLSEPFTVVLTEDFALRMFGDRDPMGETIIFDNQYRQNNEYKVTGILKDIPPSHLKIEALLSRTTADITHPHRIEGGNRRTDSNWWYATYVLLNKNANTELVRRKIEHVLADINNETALPFEFEQFQLRPLGDLYLKGSATHMVYGEQGNNDLLWSFMAIGVFVFLLATINYINLTTARSTLRSKEVIIKKVMGSSRALLRLQFIADSLLVAFISSLIALTTLQLITPKFNQLAQVNIDLAEFNTPMFWTILVAGTFVTGIMSGIYPSMMLTKFRSVASIKSVSKSGIQGVQFRKALLTFQFTISILLIIGIITNLRQLSFVKNADPGFDKEQVILVRTPDVFENAKSYRRSFKEHLLQHSDILGVAFGTGRPKESENEFHIEIDGVDRVFGYKRICPDFIDVMDMKVVEGRNFSWERKSDETDFTKRITMLINETAAEEYWEESPVGKVVGYEIVQDGSRLPVTIIGVVNDAHWLSFHDKVEPSFYFWWGAGRNMSIKLSPGDLPNTIKIVEHAWEKVYGNEPLLYSFMDQEFDALYKSDERVASIIGYFTIIAIAIACMGLFALSSFMAVRRTKEIGIRKALGASSKTIFIMLSREYIRWILLSALIASPIAWFAMNKWLESFAYRIQLGPGVFILAAVIALTIGLITVGWQALKSAVANPVEALRYE